MARLADRLNHRLATLSRELRHLEAARRRGQIFVRKSDTDATALVEAVKRIEKDRKHLLGRIKQVCILPIFKPLSPPSALALLSHPLASMRVYPFPIRSRRGRCVTITT